MFLHLMKALLKGGGVVNGYQVWLESFYNSIKGKAMRLYIIGNGFDIRHGLPTRYKHFKSYVAKNDKELYDAIEEYIPAGDEWNELERESANKQVISSQADSLIKISRIWAD
ncbi:bacteriophage abortive infection AbiH family protein, partial [Klebsiella pneumoniae]|nr:bacteriophage abortive infection AbiH family protein [Klebsiella pneumoniae]MCJ4696546.1 bacteriophage abortive infection AbiH family protein [Klebsiella pneumoniae]